MNKKRIFLYIVLGILFVAVMGAAVGWMFTEQFWLIIVSSLTAIAFLGCFIALLSLNSREAKENPTVATRLRKSQNLLVHIYPYGKKYIAAVYTMSELSPFLAWLKADSDPDVGEEHDPDAYDCLDWEKIYPIDIRLAAGNTVAMPADLYETLRADDKMKNFFRKNKVHPY